MAADPKSARDAGLRRVRLVTRWTAAGAAVLTGAIVGWEVKSVHQSAASTPTVARQPAATSGGGSSSTPPTTTDPGSTDPGYSDPGYSDPGYSDPGYSDGGGDLQAPQYAPAPSDQSPSAQSGGS